MSGESEVAASQKPTRKRGRDPDVATQREVWARGGGICARPGCGAVLYEDPIFFKPRAFGELAHNVAASVDGPRGDASRSGLLSDDPNNLILFCPSCHSLVDKPGWAQDYPEALLAQWKERHEAVIRTAGRNSHGRLALGLRYLGVVGQQLLGGSPGTIAQAAIQCGLVLTQAPVDLRVDAGAYQPQSTEYWRHVVNEVRRQVMLVQAQGSQQSAIALYGLADMPALMALGFALGHAVELYPFQWDRYAHSWMFPANEQHACEFRIRWPEQLKGPVALVLSLSGTITAERVHAVFPHTSPSIIHVTVDAPRLDLVQCAATVDAFRRELARVIERLETVLTKDRTIHVFPAIPASLAVAFGMAIKPKVSFPFSIYDAEGKNGPFHAALSLPLLPTD